jgi:hypothetical protein
MEFRVSSRKNCQGKIEVFFVRYRRRVSYPREPGNGSQKGSFKSLENQALTKKPQNIVDIDRQTYYI